MTIIVENLMNDNIAFGRGFLAHYPEEPLLKLLEFTNVHQNKKGEGVIEIEYLTDESLLYNIDSAVSNFWAPMANRNGRPA